MTSGRGNCWKKTTVMTQRLIETGIDEDDLKLQLGQGKLQPLKKEQPAFQRYSSVCLMSALLEAN